VQQGTARGEPRPSGRGVGAKTRAARLRSQEPRAKSQEPRASVAVNDARLPRAGGLRAPRVGAPNSEPGTRNPVARLALGCDLGESSAALPRDALLSFFVYIVHPATPTTVRRRQVRLIRRYNPKKQLMCGRGACAYCDVCRMKQSHLLSAVATIASVWISHVFPASS